MKHISINYILTTALALGIGISIPVLIGSTCLSEQHSVQSEVPYCVTPPTVPDKLCLMVTPSTCVVMTAVNVWTAN